MTKSSQSAKDGFKNQLAQKNCVDGVAAFNLENLLGTLCHGFIGWFIGRNIRYAVKPDFESLVERSVPSLRGRCVIV